MKKISLFFVALFTFVMIQAQHNDTIFKVTEGVYVTPSYYGNISILVTDEGVVVVDFGEKPESGEKLQKLIKTVTDKPIVQVILTHYHFDHVGGLYALPANTPILAHQNTIENIRNREKENKLNLEIQSKLADSLKTVLSKLKPEDAAYTKNDSLLKAAEKNKAEAAAQKFVIPNEHMTENFSTVKGKDTIQVMYKGSGHTNGDVVVYFINKKVMVMGDLLFNHAYPYIDPMGNVVAWAQQLRNYSGLNLPNYIPGHGKIATSADLLVTAKYLEDLSAKVTEAKKEGKSLADAKSQIQLPANEKFDFDFFREQNIEAVWNQQNK